MPWAQQWLLVALIAITAVGCGYTKYVPEGEYLLSKSKITSDTKATKDYNLQNYLQQRPNTSVLGWKVQLNLYSLSGKDTSIWINRALRKIGEAPVIYDPNLTGLSLEQLKKTMRNKGYYEAQVDTSTLLKKRRVQVNYHITAHQPYTLHSYTIDLPDSNLVEIASDPDRSLVEKNMNFDLDVLGNERQRIANQMRRIGYYYFDREYLTYTADSALGNHSVDLTLSLQENIQEADDSIKRILLTQYTIDSVLFVVDNEMSQETDSPKIMQQEKGAYRVIYTGTKLLRLKTLMQNCHIVPGHLYDVHQVERTYASLNSLGPIKYVDISFRQINDTGMMCTITLARAKMNTFSAEVEGTYSAGDWGIAAGLGYANKNIFKGAEELSIHAKASYERRQSGDDAIEALGEVSLKFPNFLFFGSKRLKDLTHATSAINISYNYQKRPNEYTRTIANAKWQYNWGDMRQHWYHTLNLIDISYVYLPWISPSFKAYFLQSSNILKYSYEDHFICDLSYNGSYSSFNERQPLRSHFTIRYGIETAGNLLYGISKAAKLPQNEDGSYLIGKIPFAQYVKGDVQFTFNGVFNANHRLVFHCGLGIAYPYGNLHSVPFEKRYFGGGANSVRGWAARTLGPGGYHGTGTTIDYNNQSGDIKLDLNLEYRAKLFWRLEGAAFVDAGNIWTIREYEMQPHGLFQWDSFYKEIALSYGIGLRVDLSFLVFRVDFGVKLYDPSRLYYDAYKGTEWRTAANGLCWKDDMCFHFAIGYPF